jgi:hypothetical protein
MLSSSFLHAGILHLGLNSAALLQLGPEAEAVLGYGTFGAVYLLSGLAGASASLLFNDLTTVGASASIFGLLGARTLVLSLVLFTFVMGAPQHFRGGVVWVGEGVTVCSWPAGFARTTGMPKFGSLGMWGADLGRVGNAGCKFWGSASLLFDDVKNSFGVGLYSGPARYACISGVV